MSGSDMFETIGKVCEHLKACAEHPDTPDNQKAAHLHFHGKLAGAFGLGEDGQKMLRLFSGLHDLLSKEFRRQDNFMRDM
jgi:hypothetical protein